METSQLSEMATVIENTTDALEKGIAENKGFIEETNFADSVETSVMDDILTDLPKGIPGTDEHYKLSKGDETKNPFHKEAIASETVSDILNHTDSITSSISDTPSSTGSIFENELAHKGEDMLKEITPDNAVPTTDWADGDCVTQRAELSQHDVTLENMDQTKAQESILEQGTREDASSDISSESYRELEDNLNSCLHVEIAAASSDSETDEKWRTIFSSSINKEDDDDYDFFLGDSLEQSARDLFIQKGDMTEKCPVETKFGEEIPVDEEILEERVQLIDNGLEMQMHESHCNDSPIHGLTNISEDKDRLCQVPNHNMDPIHSTKVDPDKKIPNDYCVIQETKSENVSTEHVDFRVARKQWLKMEEQTKSQMQLSSAKQSTCQGGHSIMYTPVRNIGKPKKDPEFDSFALREYAYTQFSPGSEDSGLDDSSCRSPYDDPETPIEREIRLSMEREERLRRERGISKQPHANKCTQDVRPVILLTGKFDKRLCQEVEEKRKMFETPDSSKSSKSPSIKTPSFIVTSSPLHGPSYHEVAANNIIILEPDSSPTSPRKSLRDGGVLSQVAKKSNDWSTETSNVLILETSNLIVRSASEICLNTVGQDTQESTFLNNPFFKLRSRSTQSLVDQEIQMVRQREEELKRQRESVYSKQNYSTVLVSPNLLDKFDNSELPERCKSSPSSPMKTAHKTDRSTLSGENRFLRRTSQECHGLALGGGYVRK